MYMNRKLTKATVCALTAVMLITGSGARAEAADKVSISLPAAGMGLAFGDGTPISQIRDDVKKNQDSSETETQTAETKSSLETESAAAGEAAETDSKAAEESAIVEAMLPIIKEPEIRLDDDQLQQQKDQETLIIAQVSDYVNIRNMPSTDGEIVGKLYNNSVGILLGTEGDWYKMRSGSVEGYVKAEYFKAGDEAKRIADEVGDRIATVNTETLRVRCEASLDAKVLGLVPQGEELTVLAEENGFVKVSIEEGDGWVHTDYVILETKYVTAESIEEERARLEEEKKAKEEARKAAEAAAKKEAQKQTQSNAGGKSETPAQQSTPAPAVSSGSGLGAAVANYAVQFVGNPYKYGGTSLTNGADCSGFVMSVYKNFGVSLPHSSSADRYVGYPVGSLAEAQPGDLICYSGHVALYIGGGQIVHASTAATGIKISNANYRQILAIRRIF